ncbi:MAG: hypothetical protein COW66_04315 [Flavobacteriaceae bacterium CG18_big_fil_WC_8_21_14_2_50_34_36]|nr:MAG: hypothetical protein COW66_04315 [Flavobacteriaceae bacterium CG18_big_fil_WC_8_21_14_2_50_34_36]
MHAVQGQKSNNVEVVKNIYETLQNSSTASKDIMALTPSIKWDEVNIINNFNERYSITFLAIINNEWRDLSFQNLVYHKIKENKILVSGTVTGRQPTECEGILTEFQHLWTLIDGQITSLTEQQI